MNTKLTGAIFILCCLFISCVKGDTALQTISNTQSGSIQVGNEQLINATINNTIPNAMIWTQVEIVNFTLSEYELIGGIISLGYSSLGSTISEDLFIAVLSVSSNSSGIYSFSLSTCPSQPKWEGGYTMVDVGDKEGSWSYLFHDIDPKYDYDVTISVGAQEGGIEENKNYTTIIQSPITYFDIDLSTYGNSSFYDVTLSLFTSSPSGFSFLNEIVLLENACPRFTFDNQLIENTDQEIIKGNSDGQRYTVTFQSIGAEEAHIAIQMEYSAIGSDLTISWSATESENNDDNGGGSSNNDETGLDVTIVVLSSTTLIFVVLSIILLVVVVFLFYKIKHTKSYQDI